MITPNLYQSTVVDLYLHLYQRIFFHYENIMSEKLNLTPELQRQLRNIAAQAAVSNIDRTEDILSQILDGFNNIKNGKLSDKSILDIDQEPEA